MPSQAWAVAEFVARRLGIEVESEARDEALRNHAADTARPIAEAVAEAASYLRITFLSRQLSAADMTRLVEDGAFPAVLFGAGRDEDDVLVLTERRRAVIHATLFPSDGSNRAVEVDAPGLVDRARRGALRALLPVEVGPYVGVEATERDLSPLQRTLRLLRRERGDVGVVHLYAALVGLLSLTLPLSVQMIVQLVQGGLFLQPVVLLIAFVVAGTLAAGGIGVAQMRIVEALQQRVFARVALELAFKVPRVPFERSLNNALPETMNRFFEVIIIQKSFLKLLTEAATALLQVLFGLILLTFYHPYFTFFGAVLLLGLYLILRITGPKGLETSLIESKYKYRAVHWLQEMTRAITAFKFAGASSMPVDRMDDLVTGYLRYRRKHFGVLLQQAWTMIAFKVVITAGLLILGTALVVDRQITLGQFVASELVMVTVLAAVEKLIGSMSTVYDMLTAVDKLGVVSDLPLESSGGLVPEAAPRGFAISLREVSYAYPGSSARALSDINLDVRAGERVALLGPDGSGQSTLLRVLGGLLEGYEGTVTYDGITLRDIDRRALRGQIGQMLSLHDLFDGTIEENITVGRPGITTGQVLRALEDARLDRQVQALPQGLRTTVSAGGGSLSVSNAKKLLLAQALVGPPRLLLLEDIVQHLEGQDRIAVIEMLCDRARPWTLLIVTPDPLFLAACDRVIVLDEGMVVLEGTYASIADHPRLRALVPAVSRAA
jgi:ABC-type bacteriocin/lantibiotic exporter with double-glycine peptidase domain